MKRFSLYLLSAVLLVGCNAETSKSAASEPVPASVPSAAGDGATTTVSSAPEAVSIPAVDNTPSPRWDYGTEKDELRGNLSYFATLESDINYDSEGAPRTVFMALRKNSRGAKDIYFLAERAVFQCLPYDGCKASYRFDNGPLKTLELVGTHSTSLESDLVFVRQPVAFTKEMKRAGTLLIELEFIGSGRQQYKFDVHGLEWNHW